MDSENGVAVDVAPAKSISTSSSAAIVNTEERSELLAFPAGPSHFSGKARKKFQRQGLSSDELTEEVNAIMISGRVKAAAR